MPDATTFAGLFGSVFPDEDDTRVDVEYGPLGDDLRGRLVILSDSPGVTTLLARITDTVQTSAQAAAADQALIDNQNQVITELENLLNKLKAAQPRLS
jgi:hypothetical protein